MFTGYSALCFAEALPADGTVTFRATAYDRFTNAGPEVAVTFNIEPPSGTVDFLVDPVVTLARGGFVEVVAQASSTNSPSASAKPSAAKEMIATTTINSRSVKAPRAARQWLRRTTVIASS